MADDPPPETLKLNYARPAVKQGWPLPGIVADWFFLGSLYLGILAGVGALFVVPRRPRLPWVLWAAMLPISGFCVGVIGAVLLALGGGVRRYLSRGQKFKGVGSL